MYLLEYTAPTGWMRPTASKTETGMITGKCCASGDLAAKDISLPKANPEYL